jgi:2-keto-myo-inositol isomerase
MARPLALHTWTLDTTPLPAALAAAAAAGFDAVELRRIDFVRCFERGQTREAVVACVKAAGLPVCTLGVEYGWLFAEGEEQDRLMRVFRESCQIALDLDCPLLMSAPGPFAGPVERAVTRARDAADVAAGYGLDLAIEFNSQHEVLNRLEVLREIVEGAGRPNLGFLLDSYHLARSGRPGRTFCEIEGSRLFAFQYSDLPRDPVTGVRRPTDRLLPGEGTVSWDEVFAGLALLGFEKPLSFEAPNPALWARNPLELCRSGIEATRRVEVGGTARPT